MRVAQKRFCDWNPSMKRRLRYATFQRRGYLREFTSAFPASMTTVLFSPTGQVMGWSFAHKHGDLPIDVNLFVNHRYRGNGLGAVLIERAVRDFKNIRLAEWDGVTRKLFRKLRKQYPAQIEVFDWYRESSKYRYFIRKARRQRASSPGISRALFISRVKPINCCSVNNCG